MNYDNIKKQQDLMKANMAALYGEKKVVKSEIKKSEDDVDLGKNISDNLTFRRNAISNIYSDQIKNKK